MAEASCILERLVKDALKKLAIVQSARILDSLLITVERNVNAYGVKTDNQFNPYIKVFLVLEFVFIKG